MSISQLNKNLSKQLNQLKVSRLLLRSIHYPVEAMYEFIVSFITSITQKHNVCKAD